MRHYISLRKNNIKEKLHMKEKKFIIPVIGTAVSFAAYCIGYVQGYGDCRKGIQAHHPCLLKDCGKIQFRNCVMMCHKEHEELLRNKEKKACDGSV